MGGAACPLHDPGNDRSIERGSDLQAARRGSLTTPAKPAGERESDAALTPRSGTRSEVLSLLGWGAPSSDQTNQRGPVRRPASAKEHPDGEDTRIRADTREAEGADGRA